MALTRGEQIERLAAEARDRRLAERAVFLAEACGGDEELRREVESLLSSHGETLRPPIVPWPAAEEDTATVRGVSAAQAANASPDEEASRGAQWMQRTIAAASTEPASKAAFTPTPERLDRGTTLGRYFVLSQLGSGGMGVVYAAYDPEIDRKVAIKLLRAEGERKAEGDEGSARLLREAQAMARLSHPNILAVHDVGTFGGHVFIVMEYVDGPTLRQWVSQTVRSVREVLGVFVQAGRALAAAHAAGLIHRDFKPENALVRTDGRVLVLDFGLARALEEADPGRTAQRTEPELGQHAISLGKNVLRTPLTRVGSLIGTPAYMAPEQLMGQRTDARVDQFAFCVALHEGLYGERPFAGDRVETLIEEVTKSRVRQPPKSSKVPAWIRAILLRGLRPNPDERYPSMDALLKELVKDPAIARRRWLNTAAAMFVVALGVLGYRQVKHQQTQQCQGAERELAAIWNPGRRAGISQAFLATAKPFAQDAIGGVEKMLNGYVASWVAMRTDACEATRLRGNQSEELLDLRMQCLSQRRDELASLLDIFEHADAKVVQKSVDAVRALTGLDTCANTTALRAPVAIPQDKRAQVEQIRRKLATAKAMEDAGKYKEGLAIATPALSEAKALQYRPLGAEALYQLGTLQTTSDPKSAELNLNDAVLAAEAGRHDEVAARAWVQLVSIREPLARFDQAHDAAKHAQAALERLGGNDKILIPLLVQTAMVFNGQGKYDEAVAYHRRAQAIAERVGAEVAALDLMRFARTLRNHGDLEESSRYFQRAVKTGEQTLGPAHPQVATLLQGFAAALSDQGKFQEAIDYSRRAQEILKRTLGVHNTEIASNLYQTGWLLEHQGRYDDALASYQAALKLYQELLPSDSRPLVYANEGVASALASQGQYEKALDHFQQALAIQKKTLGLEHPTVANTFRGIGFVYLKQGKAKDALAQFDRARAVVEKSGGPNHHQMAPVLNAIGEALAAQGKYNEALQYQQRALAIYEKAHAAQNPRAARTLTHIGRMYLGLQQAASAVVPLEQALAIYGSLPGDPNEVAETRFVLARSLRESGGDRERSLSLASSARETFAAGGPMHRKQVADVDAWLAGRAVRTP